MKLLFFFFVSTAAWALTGTNVADLQKARDRQDQATLAKLVTDARITASKQPDDAEVQYRLALASSFGAEVAVELRDKAQAKSIAETGIQAAERAVSMKANNAEYNRILGTLCGQMISSNGLAALKYGKCALNSVNKAIELDPKSAEAYLSHGVGNYYLPQALGGGIELAIKDFQKAIELDPKSSEAYLWMGIALRSSNKPSEARKAIEKSLQLNPNRLWAKQQLDKTPAE